MVDDERKMRKVIEYNSDKKIVLLMTDDLRNLKII